jgi:hypothetical protein
MEFYVSVRNHRFKDSPIIIFESDDEDEAYEVYRTLSTNWSHRFDEEREDEWWDNAPMLVRWTGDVDYRREVLEDATWF